MSNKKYNHLDNITLVQKFVDIMNNNNLSELDYEAEDVKIKISNKVANNNPHTSAVINKNLEEQMVQNTPNEKSETLYISTISNAFFVLCSFNALYQYISDSGESKIDDLSGLVNFGDILKSSYYLMDENNNSNIALPTKLDASN